MPQLSTSAPTGLTDEADQALLGVTKLASRNVLGCEAAGLTLLRHQILQAIAPTGTLARVLDEEQRGAGTGPCLTAISSHSPVIVDDLTTDRRWPALHQAASTAGIRSVLSLPLSAEGALFGTLNLYASGPGAFDADSQQAALPFAEQATSTLRYRQLFEAEHAVATTLQRGLLPEIASVNGLDTATRYVPSANATVGGDWYDLLALPDGTTGLSIGDVMGHGVTAATAMGQLRSVLRSYAWEGHTPADVLDRLDGLVQSLNMAKTATTIYAHLTPQETGARMTWSNAGHPPPLLHQPDGAVQLLTDHSILIGARGNTKRRMQATRTLPAGSTMVFYTDGLIEGHHQPLDDGLARLRRAAATHSSEHGAEALCDTLTNALIDEATDDDVALLAVQIL